MALKTGVANDGLKPKRRHILYPAKLAREARSAAFCNLPNIVQSGTRPAKKDEKALPICGLCERGATKAGFDIPA